MILNRVILLLLLFNLGLTATNTGRLGKMCLLDDDCSPPYIVCKESQCKHKDLFPMTGEEILGLLIMLSFLMVSIIVSIAGGVIIVPLSMYLMGFSAK